MPSPDPALVAVCLSVHLSICLPSSEGGWVRARRSPAPTLSCSSPSMPLGQPQARQRGHAACISGRIWGFCPSASRSLGRRPALPGHVYPSRGPQVPPQTFKALSTHPFPSLPFWPSPPHTAVPSSWAFPDSLSHSLPSPLLPGLRVPHRCPVPGPVLSTSITSSVTCGPGEGKVQPFLQMEKPRQKQVIARGHSINRGAEIRTPPRFH